jgi:steroid delta-isomerase-like uncharacterized protein
MHESRGAEARLKIVDEHIAHEVAHRLEPLVETFGDEPEWHNKAGGDVMHGHAAIRDFYAALFEGFPDFDIDVRQKHVASDAVIVEADIRGTHRGTWMGVAATGKTIRVPICAVFTFGSDDRLKAEVVYYDQLTLLSQLGVMTP